MTPLAGRAVTLSPGSDMIGSGNVAFCENEIYVEFALIAVRSSVSTLAGRLRVYHTRHHYC
jgi:hypothetical protein